jgi:adenylate cyclase
MFTDIVGYTSLTQKDESATLQALERHRNLLRPLFSGHGGREIKTIGDAFLIEFQSALDAVLCAVAVQQTMHDRKVARGEPLSLRIGIHVGDVVEAGNDILGDTVNIASRIEPLAEPGGICISDEVYRQVRNKSDLHFVSLGEKSLKNVSAPVEVHKAVMPWEQQLPAREEIVPPRDRIAVLPFVNMSPDPSDEYFADGMTEEIISTVSRLDQVEVISRTSVMQYKKNPKPIRDVSKELNVGTILEGSVRKAGNRLRITAQMIDATNDRHLWAENYDRELQDIFATQSDIARRVADAFQTRISGGVTARAGPTQDVEAYTLYLRAMQLCHMEFRSNIAEAVKLFQEAISRDSTFAQAYAGLAFALNQAAIYGDYAENVKKAEVAAQKAIELEPDLAEAHAALAEAYQQMDRHEEAIAEAKKAIQINPNYADPYLTLGMIYACIGKLEDGLEALQKGYSLNPLHLPLSWGLAQLLQLIGREREAFEVIERARTSHPGSFWVYFMMSEFYLLKGDFVKAQEALDSGLGTSPGEPYLLMNQGRLYAMAGRRKDAENSLQIISKMGDVPRGWGQVFIHGALGNMDEAFDALMKQAENHSWYWSIKSLPYFEGMRKDPRFAEFCKKVGLPP